MHLHVECSMAMFVNGLQCCDGLLSVFSKNGFPKAPDHCIQNMPKQWSMQQQFIDTDINIHMATFICMILCIMSLAVLKLLNLFNAVSTKMNSLNFTSKPVEFLST